MREVHVKARQSKHGTRYQYYFEIDSIDGKRKYISKSGFKTKTEAKEAGKLAQQEYEANQTAHIVSNDILYQDFVPLWTDSLDDLKPNTLQLYLKQLNLYCIPPLKDMPLRDITNQHLQNILTDMYDNGYSPYTINAVKHLFTKQFRWAVVQHYLSTSPCIELHIPSNRIPQTPTRRKPRSPLSKGDIQRIFTLYPPSDYRYTGLALGYQLGLRIGEAYALTWEDIDLDKKEVTIRRQVQSRAFNSPLNQPDINERYFYFSSPKYDSCRTIDILDDSFVLYLENAKRQQNLNMDRYGALYKHYYVAYTNLNEPYLTTKPTDTEIHLVNVREDGSYVSKDVVARINDMVRNKLRITPFDFHTLRHTHATELVDSGARPEYVQQRLGHKNIETTMNVYYHMTDSTRKEQSERLKQMF